MHTELLIGADVVPTSRNVDHFISGDVLSLIDRPLLDVLKSASYRIANLEVPLVDKSDPIDKCGPNLIAPTSSINGYKALGIDLLTLANNHILDQGEQGLESTLRTLDRKGIAHLGAGSSLEEAKKPYIFDFAGKKVGVYACVEHEFACADFNHPGANPYDPLESFDHVAELKKKVDYAIVLYHGGKEYYRYPSPDLQKRCRKFIDKGASLVVCQHSHIVGCEEKYGDGTIVYGQGNFLFDIGDDESQSASLLVRLDGEFRVSYVPIAKQGGRIGLAEKEFAALILDDFRKRPLEINTEGFIDKKYEEFASSIVDDYLLSLSTRGKKLLFRVINKLSGYRYGKWWARHSFKVGDLLRLENYINCEAHRELLSKGVVCRRQSKRHEKP